MNKRGQAIFAKIGIFVMVFITAVVLIQPLKDMITYARNPSNLDCTNTSVSSGTKATCIVVDYTLFYFVTAVIGLGAMYLVANKLTNG